MREQRDLRVAITPFEQEYQVVELPHFLAHQERLAQQEHQAAQERPDEEAQEEAPQVEVARDRQWTQCPVCGHWYTRASVMRRHHQAAHEGLRVRCPQCEVTFSRRDSLTKHLALFH